ncbi:MAG: N-formylglutamate amidohydrolase [Hyphomicrobiales bacterium]|nr:MAG: N-formylglutamate amidohydrolase [Hyphomicrobiales bacterium]
MGESAGLDHLTADRVVETAHPAGAGNFVLACEHASNFIPESYHALGLGEAELASHIAWDPGALDVARAMSARLDAPLVAARLSRLVYDCNRKPGAPSAAPDVSDGIKVPGNAGLSKADITRRRERIYAPFRAELARVMEGRRRSGHGPMLVTVHSFTPVHGGVRREMELGVLHDADSRLADAVLAIADADGRLKVRRNAPYGPEDGVTHTLVEHALPHGLPNVMLEIRNDLLVRPEQRKAMAEMLSDWLVRAEADLKDTSDRRRAGGTGGG